MIWVVTATTRLRVTRLVFDDRDGGAAARVMHGKLLPRVGGFLADGEPLLAITLATTHEAPTRTLDEVDRAAAIMAMVNATRGGAS